MYVGWELVGRTCDHRPCDGGACPTAGGSTTAGWMSAASGVCCSEKEGAVGTGSWHLKAQQSIAARAAGEPSCERAALQQLAMPGSRPPACAGQPASALPPRATISNRTVSRFRITLRVCDYI